MQILHILNISYLHNQIYFNFYFEYRDSPEDRGGKLYKTPSLRGRSGRFFTAARVPGVRHPGADHLVVQGGGEHRQFTRLCHHQGQQHVLSENPQAHQGPQRRLHVRGEEYWRRGEDHGQSSSDM